MNTKTRIRFKGKSAVMGRCQCGKVLIITDPDPKDNNSFETHHEAPMCRQYQEYCKNAEASPVTWAEVGKDIIEDN